MVIVVVFGCAVAGVVTAGAFGASAEGVAGVIWEQPAPSMASAVMRLAAVRERLSIRFRLGISAVQCTLL